MFKPVDHIYVFDCRANMDGNYLNKAMVTFLASVTFQDACLGRILPVVTRNSERQKIKRPLAGNLQQS